MTSIDKPPYNIDVYFTFMQRQKLLKDTFVVVNAANANYAREIMTQHFGSAWAFEYTEEYFNSFKHGPETCLAAYNDIGEPVGGLLYHALKHKDTLKNLL